jgi:ParB family transcriptional regulator, chromosome partitioning protein
LRKNTKESAAFRATAALSQETPLALGDSELVTPVRHEGRTPLRNTYLIELSLIEPDPDQPRQFFDEAKLNELAASIQSRGIRSPLTVRWHADTQKYRLVDGERRYRAAPLAGLQAVPCLLEEDDPSNVLIDQIIHNSQRADLRPYETADALVRLRKESNMTLTEIARLTGKSIGEIGKFIALVEKVAPEVQERVRKVADPSLTKRHLYTLSQLPPDRQRRLAARIEREQLTVMETERLVRAGLEPAKQKDAAHRGRPRKHIRIATKYGVVELIPDATDFTNEVLLAMLREARRELAGADFPEK